MLKENVKSLLNYSPLLKASALVAHDFIYGIRLSSGNLDTESGATHASLSEEESVSYIEEVFTDYKKYGSLDKFSGVSAELGPGDNAGVALLMRCDGCDRVDLVDRYFSRRNPEQQIRIYQALAQKYELYNFISQDLWDDQGLAGINWKIGQAAEVYFRKCAQEKGEVYDFIVSRAVLEHLYNPLDALRDMVACLKPGGRMFHKVDLRDHGMFTPKHHELTFLEIPSSIYRLMVHNTGRPNRILVHRYREVLEQMKINGMIDYLLLVTRIAGFGDITPHQRLEDIDRDKRRQGVEFVEEHRQKFSREFCSVNSTDLAIAGIFLVVTKK